VFVNPPLVLLSLSILYAASGPLQALLRKRKKAGV
jgi:hypothetical protein